MKRRLAFLLVILSLVLLPTATIAYKLVVQKYPLAALVPAVNYRVELSMRLDGHGEDIELSTYLPKSDTRQRVRDEQNASGRLALSIEGDSENRRARWKGENITGQHTVLYGYSVQTQHVRYEIAPGLEIPVSYPAELQPYLQATDGIQVNDPLIDKSLRTILAGAQGDIRSVLTAIHRHLQDKYKNRNFSGYTDALTALKLGEASCNGKSRLFAAYARKLNLPARLVGGVILERGTKRTSHQWVEVYVRGHWIPFDTINDRYAEIPANYLTLYYGDLGLFKHTANINFQYFFKMTRRMEPQHDAMSALGGSGWNATDLYAIFERIGVSQNLLKIILMLPFGALVTVVFRNVIGVHTFGTFLPALIAAAARETGLFWGALGFTLVIIIAAGLRKALDWMQLLHSPKMAIMLTFVVITLLSLTVGAVHTGLFEFAHITLFPIAILAITAERFALIETEQSFRAATGILLMTLLVMAFAYVVMDSLFLQSLVLAFPELLLIVIALNLWLGKWMGMRVVEFARFRRLLKEPAK